MLMIVKIHYSAKSKVCIIIIYYHNLPQITFFFCSAQGNIAKMEVEIFEDVSDGDGGDGNAVITSGNFVAI